MPTYTYVGTTRRGQRVEGVVEAYDEIEAMEQARQKVLVVHSVKQVHAGSKLLNRNITKPHVSPKNLAIMCSQFSIILQAGMPAPRAVALIAGQTSDKYLKGVLEEVAKDVASGHSLADSLENKGPELPRVLVETVRSGEESGRLPESFNRLHKYYDKRSKVAAKVASAMTYPLFVVCIAVVVVAVMMALVVPSIIQMVEALGADTPAITQLLINISNWFAGNWFVVLAVLVLAVIALAAYAKTEKGKTLFARARLSLPVLGAIGVNSGASQFANTMATLIASGLSANRSVEITARVMDNYVLSRMVGRMVSGLEEGRTLGECLQGCSYFPRTLVEMVSVGEQTGALEETLETVGEFYDAETQRLTDRALSLLEPALLVLMALFAGFIVIALYLPLFSLYANM